MIDFEVQRCTRCCAATGEPLMAGDVFFTVLRASGSGVERLDYSQTAWADGGERQADGAIAWWRSRVPLDDSTGAKLAPNEVLLRLFDEWADQPERSDARYVLSLLLVRRKVFRMAEAPPAGDGVDPGLLRLHCPERDEAYELPAAAPGADRVAAIQAELNQLLYSDAA